jgi:hypothetical protein
VGVLRIIEGGGAFKKKKYTYVKRNNPFWGQPDKLRRTGLSAQVIGIQLILSGALLTIMSLSGLSLQTPNTSTAILLDLAIIVVSELLGAAVSSAISRRQS